MTINLKKAQEAFSSTIERIIDRRPADGTYTAVIESVEYVLSKAGNESLVINLDIDVDDTDRSFRAQKYYVLDERLYFFLIGDLGKLELDLDDENLLSKLPRILPGFVLKIRFEKCVEYYNIEILRVISRPALRD